MRTMKGTKKNQRGYALLEYCAGAAILAAVMYAGLQSMGSQVSGLLTKVGTWAAARSAEIPGN
jgi:Flp pilus assembly pilin Flp